MEDVIDLYDRGQFRQALDTLSQSRQSTRVAAQQRTINNTAVLEVLLESNPSNYRASDICGKWKTVLRNCSSVPEHSPVTVVELSALYNWLYVAYRHGKGVEDDFYRCLCRILMRVQKLVGAGSAEKFDVSKDYSVEECNSLIKKCAGLFQLGLGHGELKTSFCRCVMMLAIHYQQNNVLKTASQLLQTVVKLTDGLKDTMMDSCDPTLTLPLYVDHRQLSMVPAFLHPCTVYTSACVLCGQGRFAEALNLLEGIEDNHVLPVNKFVTGFCLYKLGQCTDAVSILLEVLRLQSGMSQRLKARVYNLIGKCFSDMEKHQLSIQMYRQGLSADFSYLLPLYNTSLQYSMLAIPDMELECLNLLVTAIEMREVSRTASSGLDLLTLVDTEDGDISYIRALYCLANRSMHYKRFNVAAEKFMFLLQYLKSSKTDVSKYLDCLPSLLQVHHEAIEALLKDNQLAECVTLCDRVQACYLNNNMTLNSTLNDYLNNTYIGNSQYTMGTQNSQRSGGQTEDSQQNRCYRDKTLKEKAVTGDGDACSSKQSQRQPIDLNRSLSQKGDVLISSDLNVSSDLHSSHKAMTSQSSRGQSRGKRKLVQTQDTSTDGGHFGSADVVAMKFKAQALVKLGKHKQAVDVLQSAIATMVSFRRSQMYSLSSSEDEPAQKRFKSSQANNSDVTTHSANENRKSSDGTLNREGKVPEKLGDEVVNRDNPCSASLAGLDCSGQMSLGNDIKQRSMCDQQRAVEVEHELYMLMYDVLLSMKRDHDARHYKLLAAQIKMLC